MPEDSWPITKDNKIEMQALGRKLKKFLDNEFKGRDSVHIKIVIGAFQYIVDMHQQRTKAVADDFIITEKTVISNNLGDKIEEPYNVEPEPAPETLADKRARLEREISEIDVEMATPAPTDTPVIEEAPAEAAAPVVAAEDGPKNA